MSKEKYRTYQIVEYVVEVDKDKLTEKQNEKKAKHINEVYTLEEIAKKEAQEAFRRNDYVRKTIIKEITFKATDQPEYVLLNENL